MARKHERSLVVQRATGDLMQSAAQVRSRHGLTNLEFLAIVNEVARMAVKFALRDERADDTD